MTLCIDFKLPASLRDSGVSRINLGVLWALMALRDCGALIHLMAFLCCRVHRSLGSRSNFRSANPAIASRRNSTSCKPNTTGILFLFLFTNLSSSITVNRRCTDFTQRKLFWMKTRPICNKLSPTILAIYINHATINVRLRCLRSAISTSI